MQILRNIVSEESHDVVKLIAKFQSLKKKLGEDVYRVTKTKPSPRGFKAVILF